MPKYQFVNAHTGIVYGRYMPAVGDVVELDAGFAAEGVEQGFIKPVEDKAPPAKRGRSGKAE